MTSLWKNPPVTPKLQAYIYNITNHEDFLSGIAKKIRVEEIGPYIYEAPQIKKILNYSEDQSSVTFKNRVDYKYLPETSQIGLNDKSDLITMPNLVMMSGMLNSKVQPLPNFAKTSFVWPILKSVGYKTPFVTLPVADFLWGYEDELACLDSNQQDYQEKNYPFDDEVRKFKS